MRFEEKNIQLHNYLISLLENGSYRPGDELLSENQMCAAFGVSRYTVRRALEELERRKIIVRAKGKVSRFSANALELIRNLSEKRGDRKTIAIILPSYLDFFRKILLTLENESDFYDFVCYTSGTIEKESAAIREVLERRADGIIISPIRFHQNYSLENYQKLEQCGIPFVMIGKPPRTLNCDAVFAGDYLAACDATRRMIGAGCTSMVFFADFYGDHMALEERRGGFEEGTQDFKGRREILNWREPADLERLKRTLLRSKRTGILLFDDSLAGQVVQVIGEVQTSRPKLRIGDDIFIVGFNNYEQSKAVSLSSIDLNQTDLCFQAVRLICRLIEERAGNSVEKRLQNFIVVKSDLILRNTFRG